MSQFEAVQDDDNMGRRRGRSSRIRADLDPFSPFPGARRRNVLRWVLLGIHVLPFALVVFLVSPGGDTLPFLKGNMGHLIISVWALVVLLHGAIVVLLDLREGIVFARQQRRRYRQRSQDGSD